MKKETRVTSQQALSGAKDASQFIWPLGRSPVPDEMNTSFGPRIDADRWDFHDGIDLPALAGVPVYAITDGLVHRVGPADTTEDQGFGSTHVVLRVVDPKDGKNDLFLFYFHLDSVAEGVILGKQMKQGELIGAVGQEDATYPHLHFEFRKGGTEQARSVHPLNYMPYLNKANFKKPRLDRFNFYVDDGEKRMVRLNFEARDRREGDLQAVDVELKGDGGATRNLRVDFDDRSTINSDKGDQAAFKNGIAVEGYQKSNLKGERLRDLHYGVIVRDIGPELGSVKLQVLDVKNGQVQSAEFPLPNLEVGGKPVDSRVDFESQEFPPQGWELNLLPGNVCRPDETAASKGARGLLCQDIGTGATNGNLIRAGLAFALPARRMSWRLGADLKPAELKMNKDQIIYPFAFTRGGILVAAAALLKFRTNQFVGGVLIRSADGLFREKIDVTEGIVSPGAWLRWELELIRVGTRQTTAILRFRNNVVARINGNTTLVEPDAGCVGISHRHSGLQITLHVDQLFLTEAPR
jgi:hypothetical protein